MKQFCLLLFMILSIACTAQKYPDTETQVKEALMALPEEFREGATVLGYRGTDELMVIRRGSNAMYCLADDPSKNGFSVAGYHKDLEPYMARGRALRKEGKTFQEVFDIREKEVMEGKLSIPQGSTLYVLTGEYDDAGNPTNLYQRFVVYIPFATKESSGLPLAPSYPGGPWIMNPGTHRAHIMINPTKVEGE